MPDRVIRDELLESDRWLGLKDVSDRLAFMVLLLHADPLGNVEGSPGRLYRMWRDTCGVDREHVETVLMALVDRDLVRSYEVDSKRYLHIPRYRQELRYLRRIHPLSPWTTDEQKQALKKNSRRDHGVRTTCSRVEVKRSEEKRSNTPTSSDVADDGFDAFWNAYPRKAGKAAAMRAWRRLKPHVGLQTVMLTALAMHRHSEQWQRDNGAFIPHASTWLNGRRWEDQIGASATTADGLHPIFGKVL